MDKAIVVTGALGFIGSCLIGRLNEEGWENIIAVDDFSRIEKEENLSGKDIAQTIDRKAFPDWLKQHGNEVSFVFHIGARTDTTEFDTTIFKELNIEYTQNLWNLCVLSDIPLIFASSAAVYGMGELGFSDDDNLTKQLKPLNPYGDSKLIVDQWVGQRVSEPRFWAALRFFNVYGPNEYHKGRMASVVWHFYNQIKATGEARLFRSHKAGIADGEQQRDFIYVKDVLDIIMHLFKNHITVPSGIYNVGTGKARSYNDLVGALFTAMGKVPQITYFDTPEDIRASYQYFTEADMTKLFDRTGYEHLFMSLEEGVMDYVVTYLNKQSLP
jgi:ADP-L-glycero-D-manno-heptose 6-epimerase